MQDVQYTAHESMRMKLEGSRSHLKGFVHGAAGILVSARVDVAEELLQRLLPLQLLILLLHFYFVLQLVPVHLAAPDVTGKALQS